jgi:glycosyltransferase involved in cell wall biosynthesis
MDWGSRPRSLRTAPRASQAAAEWVVPQLELPHPVSFHPRHLAWETTRAAVRAPHFRKGTALALTPPSVDPPQPPGASGAGHTSGPAGVSNSSPTPEVEGAGRERVPEMSVVVPTYHEAESIAANLGQLTSALEETGISFEVLVVSDGDPETFAAARAVHLPKVVTLGYSRNRGKGFALRYGISQARGRLVTFIDSDMEVSPEEIGRMARLLDLYSADVVVGSKRHPLSQVRYPWPRRVQSLAYQLLVRALFRVKVRDTQTGLKMFRREVAEKVVDAALVKRFAFDLELLVLARHFGYGRIIEAPVRIDYRFHSTTSPKAVFQVLWDTAAIFYRLRLLHWYDRPEAAGLTHLIEELPAPLGGD